MHILQYLIISCSADLIQYRDFLTFFVILVTLSLRTLKTTDTMSDTQYHN